MVNFIVRRTSQVAVALLLCAPALVADTFSLPGGFSPYGSTPSFVRAYTSKAHGMGGVHAIVKEFEVTSTYRTPHVYPTERKGNDTRRTIRGTNRSMSVVAPGRKNDVKNLYEAAAYLAIQMIGVDRSTHFGRSQATVVTKAIWGLVSRRAGSMPSYSNGPKYYAQSRGPHGIPNINIWKPKPKNPRDPNVRVPEPSIVSLLAFNALVLAAFGYFLRRRGVGLVS